MVGDCSFSLSEYVLIRKMSPSISSRCFLVDRTNYNLCSRHSVETADHCRQQQCTDLIEKWMCADKSTQKMYRRYTSMTSMRWGERQVHVCWMESQCDGSSVCRSGKRSGGVSVNRQNNGSWCPGQIQSTAKVPLEYVPETRYIPLNAPKSWWLISGLLCIFTNSEPSLLLWKLSSGQKGKQPK